MVWLRVLLTAGLLVALGGASDARQDKDKTDLPLGEKGWDVKAFDKEPFKLIRTSYDEKAREMRWILEFTRDIGKKEVLGPGSWTEMMSPFKLRLRDEDGVAIGTLPSKSEGEFETLKGERVRIVFKLPEEAVWSKVKSVVVVNPENEDKKKDDKKDGK